MKKVAFLQNQWFRNPESARRIFDRHPDLREALIKRFLFAGCKTGRRLRSMFGGLCDEIIWEETSMNIGGESSSVFPADLEHIRKVIAKHQPKVILCFGKVAHDALRLIRPEQTVIFAPHPVARGANTMSELNSCAVRVREFETLTPLWPAMIEIL